MDGHPSRAPRESGTLTPGLMPGASGVLFLQPLFPGKQGACHQFERIRDQEQEEGRESHLSGARARWGHMHVCDDACWHEPVHLQSTRVDSVGLTQTHRMGNKDGEGGVQRCDVNCGVCWSGRRCACCEGWRSGTGQVGSETTSTESGGAKMWWSERVLLS